MVCAAASGVFRCANVDRSYRPSVNITNKADGASFEMFVEAII